MRLGSFNCWIFDTLSETNDSQNKYKPLSNYYVDIMNIKDLDQETLLSNWDVSFNFKLDFFLIIFKG